MMNDTIPNTNPCASGCNGKTGQGLCMVGQQKVCRDGQVRACRHAAVADQIHERPGPLTMAWYVLTVPLRLLAVFVCAVVLVTGICILSCLDGDK